MKICHKYEANMGRFYVTGFEGRFFSVPQGDSSKNVDFLLVEIKLLMSLLEMLNSLWLKQELNPVPCSYPLTAYE